MNCQRCGNEVQPEEVFCGQCGTATISSASPTNMVNSMLSASEDLSGPYKNASLAPQQIRTPPPPHTPSTQTPPHAQTRNLFSPTKGLFIPSHPSQETPESQQGTVGAKQQSTGFYQNATEAIPFSSNDAVADQAGNYSQQAFPGPQVQKDLPAMGQYRLPVRPPTQLFQADQYTLPRSSHPGQVVGGQGHDHARPIIPAIPPQSQKQQSSATVLIVSICLVVALISITAVVTLSLRGSSESTANNGSTPSTAVSQPTSIPTAVPTPQDTPTPIIAPTPLPDPGFAWCGPNCTNYGFSVEYPASWQLGGAPTNNGIQFTNPAQPDQTATFKAIGPTSGSAGDILNSELQINFINKPGYIPPQTTGVTTLGGETWLATTLYYQSADQQREHVAIYTIVYQSKGYSIEIQAPDPDGQQFTLVYNTYYAAMLSKFSFVSNVT